MQSASSSHVVGQHSPSTTLVSRAGNRRWRWRKHRRCTCSRCRDRHACCGNRDGFAHGVTQPRSVQSWSSAQPPGQAVLTGDDVWPARSTHRRQSPPARPEERPAIGRDRRNCLRRDRIGADSSTSLIDEPRRTRTRRQCVATLSSTDARPLYVRKRSPRAGSFLSHPVLAACDRDMQRSTRHAIVSQARGIPVAAARSGDRERRCGRRPECRSNSARRFSESVASAWAKWTGSWSMPARNERARSLSTRVCSIAAST